MISKLKLFGDILLISCLLIIGTSAECPKPYSHCNLGKEGFINVHIVPHTHDDVGWLKTVDEYYYGSRNQYQTAAVQYILDTVIPELEKDPAKRFVYVEIAFFWRWWNEQNNDVKKSVRNLVDQGRLEFVIGAWCMNDEATTYYTDIIDQQTLGLKFILKEFGECARPRSAWQIDPFGHSREQASLFAQFGFDGLFQGRIDWQDFDYRAQTKTREGLWQASSSLGKQAELFTGVLNNGYGPPPGFCFDAFCGDDPIMDNPSLEDYNVDQKVDDFIQYTYGQQDNYRTSNLIMTMGSDFQYSNAIMWFKNLDKTIKYVNARQANGSKVNIFYSTPACYLYSVNQANMSWPVKTDDFFPYAHKPHAFWTGYFTSRAALKYYVRQTNNYLQVFRQISALMNSDDSKENIGDSFGTLERAMGVLQHHDAVSGTEKQHVAYDYAKRLSVGVEKVMKALTSGLKNLLSLGENGLSDDFSQIYYCSLLNISQCEPLEQVDKNIASALYAYNPLAKAYNSWIRIPIRESSGCSADEFTVMKSDSTKLAIEVLEIDAQTKRIPERNSTATHEITFQANLSPLDFNIFYVRCENKSNKKVKPTYKKKTEQTGPIMLNNEKSQYKFDKNGNLVEITNKEIDQTTVIKQNFCYYNSFQGNNSEPQFQPSGAYIFRPLSDTPTCLSVTNFTLYRGDLFDEIHQTYNDWISQTIRLYAGSDYAEFNWQVGPIDVSNNIGKEVIIKFSSDLNSKATFYTDANGREILERVRDFRPTWKFNQSESIAGNYFPVNSRIFLRDNDKSAQLTLVTDRSQGGSSINDGSLELMLHRITLNDDSLGVGEPLNEKGSDDKGLIVKGRLHLIFDSVKSSVKIHRELAHEINSSPFLLFNKLNSSSINKFTMNPLKSKLGLGSELPKNLHLLTMMRDYEVKDKMVLLVRIEHFYETGEDSEMSKEVSVNLKDLFGKYFQIIGIKEMALGANMPVEQLDERLKWKSDPPRNLEINNRASNSHSDDVAEFTFSPMQIRTFHMEVKFN